MLGTFCQQMMLPILRVEDKAAPTTTLLQVATDTQPLHVKVNFNTILLPKEYFIQEKAVAYNNLPEIIWNE